MAYTQLKDMTFDAPAMTGSANSAEGIDWGLDSTDTLGPIVYSDNVGGSDGWYFDGQAAYAGSVAGSNGTVLYYDENDSCWYYDGAIGTSGNKVLGYDDSIGSYYLDAVAEAAENLGYFTGGSWTSLTFWTTDEWGNSYYYIIASVDCATNACYAECAYSADIAHGLDYNGTIGAEFIDNGEGYGYWQFYGAIDCAMYASYADSANFAAYASWADCAGYTDCAYFADCAGSANYAYLADSASYAAHAGSADWVAYAESAGYTNFANSAYYAAILGDPAYQYNGLPMIHIDSADYAIGMASSTADIPSDAFILYAYQGS